MVDRVADLLREQALVVERGRLLEGPRARDVHARAQVRVAATERAQEAFQALRRAWRRSGAEQPRPQLREDRLGLVRADLLPVLALPALRVGRRVQAAAQVDPRARRRVAEAELRLGLDAPRRARFAPAARSAAPRGARRRGARPGA